MPGNWNPMMRLLFCTYHKKAEDKFSSWNEIILHWKSTGHLRMKMWEEPAAPCPHCPHFRLCPRLLRHTRARVRDHQACVTSAWTAEISGHVVIPLMKFCCQSLPHAWLMLSPQSKAHWVTSGFLPYLPKINSTLPMRHHQVQSYRLPTPLSGNPTCDPSSLSSRNPFSAQAWPCAQTSTASFPSAPQPLGTQSTGHGEVGALHSVSHPGLVERGSSRNGWITPGNNKERQYTLPLYGYSQLSAWQDSAVKWENNEISSCSLEILEIWTVSNTRHGSHLKLPGFKQMSNMETCLFLLSIYHIPFLSDITKEFVMLRMAHTLAVTCTQGLKFKGPVFSDVFFQQEVVNITRKNRTTNYLILFWIARSFFSSSVVSGQNTYL